MRSEQHKCCSCASGSFQETWYLLYNVKTFWLCEITEAWCCSLRSAGRRGFTEKSARSSLTECFLSMQACFSKDIKEMRETDLCVTTDVHLTKKRRAVFGRAKNIVQEHEMISTEVAGHVFQYFYISVTLKNQRRRTKRQTVSTEFILCLFHQCSVTCEAGVQTRHVYCRLKGAGRVREDLCDAQQRPAVVRPCQAAECTHYSWVPGEWTDVSRDSLARSFPVLLSSLRSASQCVTDV